MLEIIGTVLTLTLAAALSAWLALRPEKMACPKCKPGRYGPLCEHHAREMLWRVGNRLEN